MLEPIDHQFLQRALFSNRVVLFLGAGFSCEAESKSGGKIPNGAQLSEMLWNFCDYGEEYEEIDLQTIFDAALRSGKSLKALHFLLMDHLQCAAFPDWYRSLSKQYWYRIYTTNIDDLVEKIYQNPVLPGGLDVRICPSHDFEERDQFLNKLQFIKLNGSIEDDPQNYTFSARQYAKRSTDFDIWYDHFVRDYMTHVTLFIGTNLNEPLFWRHIELRERKLKPESEQRPRSFLVCPKISTPKRDILADYNIVAIESDTESFLSWLDENIGDPPTKDVVVKSSNPTLSPFYEQKLEQLKRPEVLRLQNFYSNFELVKIEDPSPAYRRKSYLLGKEPDWQDLYHNLDAWRDITRTVIDEVGGCIQDDGIQVVALLGSAGSGKSTILRRAALHFCAEGFTCFFTTSEELINYKDFISAIEKIDQRLLIFLDDTDFALRWLAKVVELCKHAHNKPIFIIASRINRYERWAGQLLKTIAVREILTPDLSNGDINRLIKKLSEEELLGKLRGLSDKERFNEFKIRARKQILVAMKEATEGLDFNEIIRNEYTDVQPREAKILYLCIALASSEHHRLSIEQVLAASGQRSSETFSFLNRNLGGLIYQTHGHTNYYEVRHPVIATVIVDDIAPRPDLLQAYQRLLPVFAHDIGHNVDFGNRIFRLYRRLINHWDIYRKFAEKIEFARSIYESMIHFVSNDCHFWLQYGSLELEYGELSYASNYLAQAESISPRDNFVLTAKGHLRYRQAREAENYQSALSLVEEARELICDQIKRRPEHSPHPYHIFGSQELAFAHQYIKGKDDEEYKSVLESTLEVVGSGLKIHYKSPDLKQLHQDLKREWMMIAVSES